VTKLSEPLNYDNWIVWQERMRHVLRLRLGVCGIEDYTDGKIPRPENAQEDSNWDFNDNYAKEIIVNIEAVHESKGNQTMITMRLIKDLFRTSAEENADISEHLSKLKSCWERINLMDDDGDDASFKGIIAASKVA
jgi:hypothetical protein